MTVFGAPLSAAAPDREAAEDVVRSVWLAALAEAWDYDADAGASICRPGRDTS